MFTTLNHPPVTGVVVGVVFEESRFCRLRASIRRTRDTNPGENVALVTLLKVSNASSWPSTREGTKDRCPLSSTFLYWAPL